VETPVTVIFIYIFAKYHRYWKRLRWIYCFPEVVISSVKFKSIKLAISGRWILFCCPIHQAASHVVNHNITVLQRGEKLLCSGWIFLVRIIRPSCMGSGFDTRYGHDIIVIFWATTVHTDCGAPPCSCSFGNGSLYPRINWSVPVVDHSPQLMPRLRMLGATFSCPHTPLSCTETVYLYRC